MEISSQYLLEIVQRALQEDVRDGDVTTLATVDQKLRGKAEIIARQDGIISGLDVTALVFYYLDRDSEMKSDLVEGSSVTRGQVLATVEGKLGVLLTGERTALNFLMHLSGIATLSSQFTHRISHTTCQILDTRKTTPGLRLLEKRAVASGGGVNHRIGLFDMILIKENHIAATGSIDKAISNAVEYSRQKMGNRLAIEVEVRSLDEIEQVVRFPIQRIMLDNFSVAEAARAVQLIRAEAPLIEIEASGNMTLQTIAQYAETGVDYISAGALTHSALWLDLSMQVEPV